MSRVVVFTVAVAVVGLDGGGVVVVVAVGVLAALALAASVLSKNFLVFLPWCSS